MDGGVKKDHVEIDTFNAFENHLRFYEYHKVFTQTMLFIKYTSPSEEERLTLIYGASIYFMITVFNTQTHVSHLTLTSISLVKVLLVHI